MSNLKRWTQVGQGEFHKWDEPGDSLEGVWRGQRDGQYGPLGMMDVDGARLSFPLHTALINKMEHIEVGTYIRIDYTGKQTSKGGREFKAFNVFVAEAEPTIRADAPVASKPNGDDDIPF